MRASKKTEEQLFPEKKEKGVILYYRIRSVVDHNKLVSAFYGKIYGHISADFDELRKNAKRNVEIYFTYYLNPTPNDRNVEFDPKQNLFTNLGEFEQVHRP